MINSYTINEWMYDSNVSTYSELRTGGLYLYLYNLSFNTTYFKDLRYVQISFSIT